MSGGWQGLDELLAGALVVVLGAGRSGLAAARLLVSRGLQVKVYDERVPSDDVLQAFRACGVSVCVQSESPAWDDVGLCVTSPGFSMRHPWLWAARDAAVTVVGELELGASACQCPIIAVTGTNGKTTCVELICDLLVAKGKHAEVAGNIGRPLSEVAPASAELDWLVVEVSSFQLESVLHFHPQVAVLLNIQPDHLDRHRGMEEYIRLKSVLFDNQGPADVAYVDAACVDMMRELTCGNPSWCGVGGEDSPVTWSPGVVRFPVGGEVVALAIDGSVLDNAVTGPAVAASVAVVATCTQCTPNGVVSERIREFKPAAHRFEAVDEIEGVSFIDDSKATNLGAMMAALERSDRRVHLVAGGIFKEKDPEKAKQVLARKVECVYLIGRDASRLADAWSDVVECRMCGAMDQAVRMAWEAATAGEVVLLSPACASFDQFRGYSARGMAFREIVGRIKEERVRCVQHG